MHKLVEPVASNIDGLPLFHGLFRWWNESSINNIYDEYASIDLDFEIEKIHFIMELDLMMVLSRPQNGRDAKMYWLSINNGVVIPNEEIMTRIGPGKPIKECTFKLEIVDFNKF